MECYTVGAGIKMLSLEQEDATAIQQSELGYFGAVSNRKMVSSSPIRARDTRY